MRSHIALTSLPVLLVLTAACAQQPAPPPDTPENRLELARALTAMEVEAGEFDQMLDSGAELARQATADALTLELEREPTAEELAQVEATMRAVLAEFLTAEQWQEAVARIYAEHFTTAELAEVKAFFSTPTGAKVIGLSGQLDEEAADAAEAVLAERLDELGDRIDEELAIQFPELAEGGS